MTEITFVKDFGTYKKNTIYNIESDRADAFIRAGIAKKNSSNESINKSEIYKSKLTNIWVK